jgi:cyclase
MGGPAIDRRDFLGRVVGGAAGYALASRFDRDRVELSQALLAQTPRSPLTATALSDTLTLFSGAGGNVVVAAGPDGLVMVNGGTADRSTDLLEAISERARGRPVQYLFNTDWRRQYTGSNEPIGLTRAKIVAHEHTRQYLANEIYVDWEDRIYKPLPARALPNQTFYASGTLDAPGVGGERVVYGHLGQAHTDAAIYVSFPASNVLVAGGALSVGVYPIPDYTTGGWLGGLVAANKTLLGLTTDETRIVPGSGPIQTRVDLQAQHDMLAGMMEQFVKMMRQGLGPEDIIAAAATGEYDRAWGKSDLFVSTSYRSLWLHVRELGGIV